MADFVYEQKNFHNKDDMYIEAYELNYTDVSMFYTDIHDFCQFDICLCGTATAFINSMEYKLRENTLIFTLPGQSHRFIADEGSKFMRLNISAVYMNRVSELYADVLFNAFTQIVILPDSCINGLIYSMKCIENNRYMFGTELESAVIGYPAFVISSVIKSIYETNTKLSDKADIIDNSIKYIDVHLCEKINLELLATLCNMNKFSYMRTFSKVTGMTVYKYITAKRLELSTKLIISGESAVNVFSKCGFSDYSVFFRAFVKQYGMSPVKYLSQYEKKLDTN